MTNLNNVVIEGRLVHDAKDGYKQGANGTAYGSFTIAVNRSEKGQDGQWKDEASFIDCKGFGKGYDYAVPRMGKGSMVRLVGSLRQEKWQNKEGKNMSKIVVVVDKFFTEWKKPEGQGQAEQQAPQAEGFAEDLPF